ncbi:MAG: MoaD/ThiS family protein [Chthoniobacterales bacterium]
MTIRIQFFSRLREIGGSAVLEREVAPGTTVGAALAELERDLPKLADWQGKLLLAVGVEFAPHDQILQANDLLSVMPPVQGG